jgi:phosphonate transport system substrate-binding protein
MKIRFLLFWVTICLLLVVTGSSLAQSGNDQNTFYFAVSAMASPAHTLVHFADFRNYLSKKLKVPVTLKQRRTYEEINNLLAMQKVQMAFTCTGGYLSGRKAFGLEILAVPIMNGKTTYRSYIITRKENPAQTLAELKGSVFAFTDRLSLTGFIFPSSRIIQMGTTTTTFFRKTFFTESHDKSIEAVATGLADAAAVDSLIFDSLYKQGNPFTQRLKIIDQSGEFGMPPVVVPPGISVEIKRKLLKVLLSIREDREGKKVIHSLGIDGFVLPDHDSYRSAILACKLIAD